MTKSPEIHAQKVQIDGEMLHQGPKTDEERLSRAILAQQVARHLRAAVAGYHQPHPRLRARAIAAIGTALDTSAMTVERLDREGTFEERDFSGIDVTWPIELTALFGGSELAGAELPDEVTQLYFGGEFDPEDLESLWTAWRDRTEPPHDCWWAYWRVDKCLSAGEAQRRAEAAREARVTPKTGTSWVERDKVTRQSLIFFEAEES